MIEDYSSLFVVNNRLLGNETSGYGGGIYCGASASPQIINCTMHGNSAPDGGGGVCCFSYCKLVIRNSILWGNASGKGPEICIGGGSSPSTLTISHSDVRGGQEDAYIYSGSTLYWGTGMIDADPLFVDAAGGDVHLTYLSPCKDTGSLPARDMDFEGDPRPSFGRVDMGADEFHDHLYFVGDASPGGAVEVRVIGRPMNEVILYLGHDLLDPPLNTKYGKWFLQPPVLPVVMGMTSWQGIVTLRVRIPAFVPVPTAVPMQALVRNRLTNLSVVEIDS